MTRASVLCGVLFCSATAALSGCGPAGPAVLEFVDITPPQPKIGEIATVRFRAIDNRGEPAAGVSVKFSLVQDTPGVTLSPTEASTQKGSGEVTTQLVVSGRVASVAVVADAGGGKRVTTPSISFANSGVPNGRQFTFQCGPRGGDGTGGIHALHAYDATRHFIAGTRVNCWAHVGDRNTDGVPDALVSFLTEAGTIGPTTTSTTDGIGDAQILYKLTYPLPKDVEPGRFTWNPTDDTTHMRTYLAPLWMHPFEWKQNPVKDYALPATFDEPRRTDPIRKQTPAITNNPRDNLVTMIAITAGEEEFTDSNNNGTFDQGEAWEDLTEPFVDSNDNGTWDSDEQFVDANGDGRWTAKNDKWDANTLIWVAERIIWTGSPGQLDQEDTVAPIFTRLGVSPNQSCTDGMGAPINGTAPCIRMFGANVFTFLLSDPWFNSIAQNSTSDGCKMRTGSQLVKLSPETANEGLPETYPPTTLIGFSVADVRDPNAMPIVPKRVPPLTWDGTVYCDFTSSPLEGYITRIGVAGVGGYIE